MRQAEGAATREAVGILTAAMEGLAEAPGTHEYLREHGTLTPGLAVLYRTILTLFSGDSVQPTSGEVVLMEYLKGLLHESQHCYCKYESYTTTLQQAPEEE